MSKPAKTQEHNSIDPSSNRHSIPEKSYFGADFIPFEAEFRLGDDIPGKRKRDQIESNEPDQRQPRLARYEDGSFTTPWMGSMDSRPPRDAAEFFHTEVEAFANYISPSSAEHSLRELIIDEIQFYARKIWPDATATAFGSFATSLYLPTGDIDIVIQTTYASATTRNSAQNALMRLASTLRNAGLAERRRVQVIAARVSIVKFNSVHGGISIDISLNQTTGLTAITVIKKHLDHFPALRPLILIIKAYLNQRGMNEVYKGGLGSYSIICMAISFLQMHPKIRLGEIDPAENLGVLLVEFFEFYGSHFNYKTISISINRGGSYFLKMQKGWQDLTKPWLLSIADPTDETNDVSRGSFQMLRLRQTLGGAALILKTRLQEVNEQIRSINDGYRFRLQASEPLQTILGKLIAMSPEAIRQRDAISDAYYSGKLHRVLNLPLPSLPKQFERTEDTSKEDLKNKSQQRASQSLRKETHAFSEGDSDDGNGNSGHTKSLQDAGKDEEDSRYKRKHGSGTTSRRVSNRFETLGDRDVQYILSDSDGAEEIQDNSSDPSIAHASKRRQIEAKSPRPTLLSRTSRKSYWASKGQVSQKDSP